MKPTPNTTAASLAVNQTEYTTLLNGRLSKLHEILAGCQQNFGEGMALDDVKDGADLTKEQARIAPPAFDHVRKGLAAARSVIELALMGCETAVPTGSWPLLHQEPNGGAVEVDARVRGRSAADPSPACGGRRPGRCSSRSRG